MASSFTGLVIGLALLAFRMVLPANVLNVPQHHLEMRR